MPFYDIFKRTVESENSFQYMGMHIESKIQKYWVLNDEYLFAADQW